MDGWMDAEGMEDGGDVRLRKWGCVEGRLSYPRVGKIDGAL